MIILLALSGLLIGWLLCWAADYLPRFSASSPTRGAEWTAPPTLALWRFLTVHFSPNSVHQHEQWFGLRLGAELLSALFFAYLWVRFGPAWNLLILAGGYAFFLLIAIIDLKYRLVLNVFTYPAIAAILFYHVVLSQQNTLGILLGGALAFSIFFLTAWLKPGELGGGDVKLATLIGFVFGFPQVLWALIIGAGIGGIVAVWLLLTQRGGMKSHIPYAPFLCLGALAALLYNPLLMTV